MNSKHHYNNPFKKPIVLKTIRGQRRPQYNFFRYGFDLIRDHLTTIKRQPSHFLSMIINQLGSLNCSPNPL